MELEGKLKEFYENDRLDVLSYEIICEIQLGMEQAETRVLKDSYFDADTKLKAIRWLMEMGETLAENTKTFIGAMRDNKPVKSAEDIELSRLMEERQITIRTCNVFRRAGYDTLQAVSELTETQAKHLRNCGAHTIKEIKCIMDAYGMSFKEEEQ